MYKTVMLDGEEITIRVSVNEEEKERIIRPDLDKTDDLTEVITYINENQIKEENNE